jgi:hypothetical protein
MSFAASTAWGMSMNFERFRRQLASLVVLGLLLPALASAQVPPRFYWKSLSGASAVPVIYQSMNGNANPLDYSHLVSDDMEFEADIALAGYARVLPLFGRQASLAVLVPTGRVTGTGIVAGNTISQSASGFGDPMLELNVNLVGADPIMNIPDLMRYEPGFSLDLLVDLMVPIGEHDDDQVVNLGQNRWYGRIGTPIVWQLGAWVPGRRTTLELLPSLWIYGDNDNYLGDQTLETDPMFQLETHLTRDFTERFWGSLDLGWVAGGKSTINGVSGSSLDSITLGYTLGYQVNDNMQLTFGYMATVNDSEPADLKMDGFQLSLVFGWHSLIEGMRRLGGE